jgi:hypothetical protein
MALVFIVASAGRRGVRRPARSQPLEKTLAARSIRVEGGAGDEVMLNLYSPIAPQEPGHLSISDAVGFLDRFQLVSLGLETLSFLMYTDSDVADDVSAVIALARTAVADMSAMLGGAPAALREARGNENIGARSQPVLWRRATDRLEGAGRP